MYKNNKEQYKSTFYFYNKFISYIYELFYSINRDTKESLILFFLSSLSKLMQLLYLCFHPTLIWYFNNTNFVNIIQQILNITQFQQLLKKTTLNFYLISYFCILFITIFILILFILMIYRISKKKKIPTFVKYLFKVICYFILYFLYLPTLEFYMSMLICTKINNKNVLKIFPELECFNYLHNALFIISIIFGTIHIFIIFLFAILYFNPFLKSKSIEKSSSNSNYVFLIFYQTLGVIIYNIIGNDNSFLRIFIFIFVFSIIIFYLFNNKSNYYLSYVNKTFRILAFINLWTVVCILVSKIISSKYVNIPILWIVGIIIISFVIIISKTKKEKDYYTNIYKIQDENIMYNHLEILIRKVAIEKLKKNIDLEGYLINNKLKNDDENSPLNKEKINDIKEDDIQYENKLKGKLNNFIIYCFKLAWDKFSNNIDIKIIYGFFLLEIIENKSEALDIIQKLENIGNLDFVQKFKLFILKKEIELFIDNNKNKLELGNHLRKKKFFNEIELMMEKITFLLIDFWSILKQERPNCQKWVYIGLNIQKEIKLLHKKLKIISFNSKRELDILNHIGNFYLLVLNDKKKGEKIINNIKNNYLNKIDENELKINILPENDLGEFNLPIIFISAQNENFCKITNLNSYCSNIFGYNKNELINKKVEILMSDIFGNNHNYFVSNYLKKRKGKMINTLRFVLGKHFTKYLMPLNIKIRPYLNSSMQITHFMAIFSNQIWYKPIAYIVINKDGKIIGISFGCINLLGLNIDKIEDKTNINNYIINFMDHFEKMKITKDYKFYPKFNFSTWNKNFDLNFNLKQKDSFEYKINIQNVFFENLQIYLYYVKFERNFKETFQKEIKKYKNVVSNISSNNINNKVSTNNFHFSVNLNNQKFYGSYQKYNIQEIFQNFNNKLYNKNFKKMSSIKDEDYVNVKLQNTYDIIHIQLINNQLVRIYNDNDETDNLEELIKEEQNIKKENLVEDIIQEDWRENDINNIFNNQDNLTDFIKKNNKEKLFKNLRFLGYLIFILWILFSIIILIFNFYYTKILINKITFLKAINIQRSYFISILLIIQKNIILSNNKVVKRIDLYNEINPIINKLKINYDIIKNDNINIKFLKQPINIKINGEFKNFNFIEINDQFIGILLELITNNSSSSIPTSITSPSINFFVYNLSNNFYIDGEKIIDEIIFSITNDIYNYYYILIIFVSLIFILILLIILVYYILIVIENKNTINLEIFLSIKDKCIKKEISKCENFILNIREKDTLVLNNEDIIDQDEKSKNEEYWNLLNSTKKKFLFDNNFKITENFIKLFSLFFIGVVFLIVYFIIYQIFLNFYNNMKGELKIFAYNEIYFPFSFSMYNNYILDNSFKFKNINNSDINNYIFEFYNNIQNIENVY